MIGRFGRTVRERAIGGFILLLLASILAAPDIAAAKPRPEEPGPMPEGDPTADDQPSPTPPKKTAGISRFGTNPSHETIAGRRLHGGRMTWEMYLRILSRMVLR